MVIRIRNLIFQLLQSIDPVMRTCAAVSDQQQKIPVFFRQPNPLLLLKSLYGFLAGRLRQFILMTVRSKPFEVRILCPCLFQ